jgi:hypothetical protein
VENEKKKIEKAKEIAKSKVDSIRHLGTYAFVMVVLAVINNLTDPGGSQWWLWPAAIWGVFVLINFLKVFIFKGSALKRYEEQLTKREMEKMDRES